MLRYGCLLLGLLVLSGCKSVDVPIYAAYPLAKESAVVLEPLTGAKGDELGFYLLKEMKQRLPSLAIYQVQPRARKMVILRGQVMQWNIQEPAVTWGAFDAALNKQAGEVHRESHAEVRMMLLRTESGEVLWSDIFPIHLTRSSPFSVSSSAAIHELDVGSDLMKGHFGEAVAHAIEQDQLHDAIQPYIPSAPAMQSDMLQQLSGDIARSFYDRVETHWELK